MWMIKVETMCQQHLLGEHVECHMISGSINKKKSLRGFAENNCLQLYSLKKRHDEIATEMGRRGMNHKSPLEVPDVSYLSDKEIFSLVDQKKSHQEIKKRCEKCKKIIENAVK
jgi:hypothetical protein